MKVGFDVAFVFLVYLLNMTRRYFYLSGIRIAYDRAVIKADMIPFMLDGYEADEINFAKKYLSDEDSVVEVGGGIGYMSTYCIKHIGIKQYCVVEADPRLIDVIRTNQKLNGVDGNKGVKIINKVIANVSGNVDFYISERFWASSTYEVQQKGRFVNLETISFAEIVEAEQRAPTALIMDIEGGEIDIEPDAYCHFDKIIMEIHPAVVGGEKISELINGLIQRGYKMADIAGNVCYFERQPEA